MTSSHLHSLNKWQIIDRFQIMLRRFRSERKLTFGEIAALEVLPEFMCADGTIYPSHEEIAEKSGTSRRTVIKALKRAYKLGIVKHTPRGRASNTYEIIFSIPSEGGE